MGAAFGFDVDLQTLPKMCKTSSHIRILKVKKFDKEKGVIVYDVVEKLKGQESLAKSFKHAIGKPTDESKPISIGSPKAKKR